MLFSVPLTFVEKAKRMKKKEKEEQQKKTINSWEYLVFHTTVVELK